MARLPDEPGGDADSKRLLTLAATYDQRTIGEAFLPPPRVRVENSA